MGAGLWFGRTGTRRSAELDRRFLFVRQNSESRVKASTQSAAE